MKELLVATGNKGKFHEMELLLKGTGTRLFSLKDFPGVPTVNEDGADFAENAIKKAKSAAEWAGKPTIADDSGLVVDALDGRPGVLSARFGGERATDAENNAKLLREMKDVPNEQRTASFRCVIAFCIPDGYCCTFDGELRGILLNVPRGTGGFGYDPLFMVPEYGKTLAELSMGIKNRISHRGKALAGLMTYLQKR